MNATVLYIVIAIVVAHFIAGFAFLIYKIYGNNDGDKKDRNTA